MFFVVRDQDPEPLDPLDSVIGAQYLTDRDAYDSAAYLNVVRHGRVPRSELLARMGVRDEAIGGGGAGTAGPAFSVLPHLPLSCAHPWICSVISPFSYCSLRVLLIEGWWACGP
jgi:hypothetical protein